MRIYLDACCLSRLTDDQSQARIREEAEAVEKLLGAVRRGLIEIVTSEALDDEVRCNPSMERRAEAQTLLSLATMRIEITNEVAGRAAALVSFGYALTTRFTSRPPNPHVRMPCSRQTTGC